MDLTIRDGARPGHVIVRGTVSGGEGQIPDEPELASKVSTDDDEPPWIEMNDDQFGSAGFELITAMLESSK